VVTTKAEGTGRMSSTTVRLLQSAVEIVGGNRALAARLGITETRLALYVTGRRQLPDSLLLRAVDIILADRQSRFMPASQPGLGPPKESLDV